MSRIRANKITDKIGTGAIELEKGAHLPVGMGITGAGNINLSGIITATSISATTFSGVDSTALKDPAGNVKVQAQASGAVYTGIHTFTTLNSSTGTFSGAIDANGDLDVDGHTNLDNVSIAGVTTATGAVTLGDDLNIAYNKRIKLNSVRTEIFDDNNLRIDTDGTIIIRKKTGYEMMASLYPDAGVWLYYNNAKKFETSEKGIQVGTGVTVETNGQATFTGIVTALNFVKTDGTTVGGAMTGYNNDPGENNVTTFIAGRDAGNNIQLQNSDGQSAIGNVLIGDGAGKFAQNGYDYNVSIGSYAHNKLRDGSYNIAIGYRANPNVSTQASSNTIAIGYETLANFVGGGGPANNGRNTVVGHAAAGTLQSGGYNLVIGYGADVSSASVSNECTIGAPYGSSFAPNHFRIPGIGVSFSEVVQSLVVL